MASVAETAGARRARDKASVGAMKALVYTANSEMTYRDEPSPQPAHGEVVVAIDAAGICGSDMHAYLGHDPRRVPPLILGHEAVGTVLTGGLRGQAVVINPLITCGRCDACAGGRQNLCAERDLIGMVRGGAFAERVAVPEENLIPLPKGMERGEGRRKAALTEPGATALHAIELAEKSLARPISEARVAVIGGGSVGLLTALFLVDKGAREVRLAETNALRIQTARDALGGKVEVFDPLSASPPENYFDAVFDAVGNAHTRKSSVACARPGAVVVHIGLMDSEGQLDVRRMTLQQIIFIGSYTYTPLDLRATLDKLHSGALGELAWIETRPLSEGARAFQELLAGDCAAAKVVLTI